MPPSRCAPGRRRVTFDDQVISISRELLAPEVLKRAGIHYDQVDSHIHIHEPLDQEKMKDLLRQSQDYFTARSLRAQGSPTFDLNCAARGSWAAGPHERDPLIRQNSRNGPSRVDESCRRESDHCKTHPKTRDCQAGRHGDNTDSRHSRSQTSRYIEGEHPSGTSRRSGSHVYPEGREREGRRVDPRKEWRSKTTQDNTVYVAGIISAALYMLIG